MQLLWQCELNLLQAREDSGVLLQARLEAALRRAGLAPTDQERARNWVLDVMRWHEALDALIAWRLEGREQPRPVHQLLRLALAQLCFTRQVPPAMVVASAAGFARANFRGETAAFIRQELHACVHSLSGIEDWLCKLRIGRPEKGYSHPFWLVERWTRQLGRERAHRLLAWNNTAAPVCARVNTFKTTATALQQQWQAEGLRAVPRQSDWTGVGFMARYGSERIRGHGIPEAIEAILLKGGQIEPKVALLKPISSAISIGSGGPFGAEGPIIMTGGAFGSMIAQLFHRPAPSAERCWWRALREECRRHSPRLWRRFCCPWNCCSSSGNRAA